MWGDHSYLRLVRRPGPMKMDLKYKAALWVIAVSVYLFWLGFDRFYTGHIHLTVLSMVFSAIVRSFNLVEIIVNSRNDSLMKIIGNGAQIIAFSIHCVVMVFYWSVLAADEYANGMSTMDNIVNILEHVVAPLVSIIPVIVERMWFNYIHLAIVVLFGFAYVGFMWIYVASTGKPVYDVFDFKTGWSAFYAVVAIALSIIFFFVGFWINRAVERRFQAIHKELEGGSEAGQHSNNFSIIPHDEVLFPTNWNQYFSPSDVENRKHIRPVDIAQLIFTGVFFVAAAYLNSLQLMCNIQGIVWIQFMLYGNLFWLFYLSTSLVGRYTNPLVRFFFKLLDLFFYAFHVLAFFWNITLSYGTPQYFGSFNSTCDDGINFYADIYRYIAFIFAIIAIIGTFAMLWGMGRGTGEIHIANPTQLRNPDTKSPISEPPHSKFAGTY